ncbi:MAG: 5-formyltetrahydrofolate cyclo-ligase [Coriobacteriaceae bacterium]|nr:5-formyltetrahydrofolate cyclo-ligase [Coriobacteriaceae bacterium]
MGNEAVDIRKKELRRCFRTIRKELGEEKRAELDAAIEANLVSLPEFAEMDVLLAYLDFGPEVRTRGIIQAAWDAGKTVALPWCVPNTHEMRWFKIMSFNDLVRSSLGVEEPVPNDDTEQLLGTGERMMALVPGLTFDAAGYRLGYGGGFYDTFLAKFDGVSVGLCREAQFSDDLVAEGIIDAHDLPAQLVVTEDRVIRV